MCIGEDIKTKKNKEEIKEEINENFLEKTENEIKPKFSEQTDLEDFTDPIIEIKKDSSNKVDENREAQNLDEENSQKKPNSLVQKFIKKVSSIKIFNLTKKKKVNENDNLQDTDHSMDFLEKEDVTSNKEIVKKKDEKIVINEEQQEKMPEITEPSSDLEEKKPEIEEKKVQTKSEKVENPTETNKDEEKNVQIQSEMSGLDDKKDEKKSKDDEDLDIPSFLRNQSN